MRSELMDANQAGTPLCVEWSGAALHAVRDARSLSIAALSESTRIRRVLIEAIENENFGLLPAIAFTRGLVVQIAKRLGLPEEDVANAYVRRYEDGRRKERNLAE